jgi:Ferritin-like
MVWYYSGVDRGPSGRATAAGLPGDRTSLRYVMREGRTMTDVVSAGPHGPLAHVLEVRGGETAGPRFGLHHREALIYTLGKAAELEHLIMLQYLFAAFSLRQSAREGLSAERVDVVRPGITR